MKTPYSVKPLLLLLVLWQCGCTKSTVSYPELKYDSWSFGTTLSSINTSTTGDTLLLGSADNGSIRFFIPDSLSRTVKIAEGGDRIYKVESLGSTDGQTIRLLVSVRNKGVKLVEVGIDKLEARVVKTFLCDADGLLPRKLDRYSAYDWAYSPANKARYIATSNGLWKITDEMLSGKEGEIVAMELLSDRETLQSTLDHPIRSITSDPARPSSLYYTSPDGFYHLDAKTNHSTRLYEGNYFYSTIDNHDSLYVLGKEHMLRGKAENDRSMQVSENEGMAKLLFRGEDPAYEYRIFEKSKALVDGERCVIPAGLQDKNSFLKTRAGYYFVSYDKLIKVYPHQNISSTRKAIMAVCRKNDSEILILDNQYNLYQLGLHDRKAHRLGQLSKHQRVRMMAYAHHQLYLLTEGGLQVCSSPRKTFLPINPTIQLTDWEYNAMLNDDGVNTLGVFKNDTLLMGTRNGLWYVPHRQAPVEIKLRWNGQLLADIRESGYVSAIDADTLSYRVSTLNFGMFEGRRSIQSEISNRGDVESPDNILSVASCNNTWAISSGDSVHVYNYRSNTVERKYSIAAYAKALAILENAQGCNLYSLSPKGIAQYTLEANSYRPRPLYFADIPFQPYSSFKMSNEFYVCSSDIGVCLIKNGETPEWITNYDDGTVLSATDWLSMVGALVFLVIILVLAIRFKKKIEVTHQEKEEITVKYEQQITDLNQKEKKIEEELSEKDRIIKDKEQKEKEEKQKEQEIEEKRKQERDEYIAAMESHLAIYHYLKFDKFKEIPEGNEEKYAFLKECEEEVNESIEAGLKAINTQRAWLRKAAEAWREIAPNVDTSELQEKVKRYFASDISDINDIARYEAEKKEVYAAFIKVKNSIYSKVADDIDNALKTGNPAEITAVRNILMDIHDKVFFNDAVETDSPNGEVYERVAFVCMSGVKTRLSPQQIITLSYDTKEESKDKRAVIYAKVSDYKDKGENKRLSRILAGRNRNPVKKGLLDIWKELFFTKKEKDM